MLLPYRATHLRPSSAFMDEAFKTFDQFFQPVFRNWEDSFQPPFGHGIQLTEDESEAAYLITAQVPGLKAEDLKVEVKEGILSLEIKRETSAPEGFQPLLRERAELSFQRNYRLGEDADKEQISASLQEGVLKLTIAKKAPPKPQQITVKVISE